MTTIFPTSYKAIVATLALFAIILMAGFSDRSESEQLLVVSVEPSVAVATTSFPQVTIEARAAYVYDMLSGAALYEKESELQLPLASLTKVMSAYTAATLLPPYMLVRVSASDVREEGDSGLRVGEEWNIQKLLDFSLITSSNDGMAAIASSAGTRIAAREGSRPEKLFVERMNTLAYELGLTQTYFLNQSGLDESATLSGGYGSAKDMAILFERILRENPRLLEATSHEHYDIASKHALHDAENTNKIIDAIPRVLASKTGYTDLSGGNLVVAFDAGIGHPIIVAVLGSSFSGRFDDMKTLVDATLEYLSSKTAE